MGRTDDVINVAGHRLSTGEMEEVLSGHTAVAECAVIGISDTLKGQVPFGLVVIKNGIKESDDDLIKALKNKVRAEIGAIASLKGLIIVERLPKTRSGKIMRRILRKIASNDTSNLGDTSTLLNPEVVQDIMDKSL